MKEGILKSFQTKIEPDVSDYERRLIELIKGSEPKNEEERNLINQINEAKKSGKIIDIPSN